MLDNYYTETIQLYSMEEQNVQGVMKDVKTLVDTFKGVIDKAPTSNAYSNDRDTFIYTNVLFCDINSEIVEGRIITHGSHDYDIVSSVDPMSMGHHLEVLLNRRS